jgi:hypothetical protein
MKLIFACFAFVFLVETAVAEPLHTAFVSATPTIDTNIYAAGDTVGTLMTFSGTCLFRTGKGEVLGGLIFDKDKEAADLDLVCFNSTPAGTFTDNAAFDPTDAGLAAIQGSISFTTHKAFSDNGISVATGMVDPVQCDADGKLYCYLVSRGTPTYTSASDLTVVLKVVAD